jgi:hypothetical protein
MQESRDKKGGSFLRISSWNFEWFDRYYSKSLKSTISWTIKKLISLLSIFKTTKFHWTIFYSKFQSTFNVMIEKFQIWSVFLVDWPETSSMAKITNWRSTTRSGHQFFMLIDFFQEKLLISGQIGEIYWGRFLI